MPVMAKDMLSVNFIETNNLSALYKKILFEFQRFCVVSS